MTNWWENGNGNGGSGWSGTCRDGCVPGRTKCTFGCTDPLAPNYDPLAQCDDGSCDIITYGDCDDTSWDCVQYCPEPCVPINIKPIHPTLFFTTTLPYNPTNPIWQYLGLQNKWFFDNPSVELMDWRFNVVDPNGNIVDTLFIGEGGGDFGGWKVDSCIDSTSTLASPCACWGLGFSTAVIDGTINNTITNFIGSVQANAMSSPGLAEQISWIFGVGPTYSTYLPAYGVFGQPDFAPANHFVKPNNFNDYIQWWIDNVHATNFFLGMNEAEFDTAVGSGFVYMGFKVWHGAWRATSIDCDPGPHYCSETFGLGGTYPTKVDCEVLCGGSSTSLASIYLDGSSSSSNSNNWWENSIDGGVSGTWWGGGDGNGGAAGTCRDDCGAAQNKCTFGCIDPLAPNYDPLAQCDDGSCDTITYGCDIGPPPPPPPPPPSYCEGNTYIQDNNFEAFLETHQPLYSLPALHVAGVWPNTMGDGILGNNNVDCSKMGTALNLCCNQGITDLTGIEDFTGLTQLKANMNQLTSLNVSNNTALTTLDISSNKLFNLDVSNNDFLTDLRCQSNYLTSLDVSSNIALTHLWCSYQYTCISGTNCGDSSFTSLNLGSLINLNSLTLDARQGTLYPGVSNLVIHVGTAARVTQAQGLFVVGTHIDPGTTFAI